MGNLTSGYVEVVLLEPFAGEMIDVLLQGEIVLPEYNFHCTLMYDKSNPVGLVTLNPHKEFKANILQIDVLGSGLVFHLTSPALVEEHLRLAAAGYKHSFEAFLPHMTLSYDFDEYDFLKTKYLFSNWGGRELVFGNEQFGEG